MKFKEGQIVEQGGKQFKVVGGCLRHYEPSLFSDSEIWAIHRFQELGLEKGRGKKNGKYRKAHRIAEAKAYFRYIVKDGKVKKS